MQYTQLGRSGPVVSTIGFGSWAIGGLDWGPTDDEESTRALHEALGRGVTFIDTADVYGRGHSEELIARVIAERGADNVVIATKAGSDFYHATKADDSGYGPIRQNYEKDYLIFAAEQSIKRLGIEALDLLQLHSGDLEQLERDDGCPARSQAGQTGGSVRARARRSIRHSGHRLAVVHVHQHDGPGDGGGRPSAVHIATAAG